MTEDESQAVLSRGETSFESTALAALAAKLQHWPLLLTLARAALEEEQARKVPAVKALANIAQKLTRHGIVAFDQGVISLVAASIREPECLVASGWEVCAASVGEAHAESGSFRGLDAEPERP